MTAEIAKKDRIINRVKSKIAKIKTAEIEVCLYSMIFPSIVQFFPLFVCKK